MELQTRKSNRLKDYDYSQNGAYFVTICVKDRKPILSVVENVDEHVGETCGLPSVCLSDIGETINNEIQKLHSIYNDVFVDNYVIMPNHIHLIICIDNNGRPQCTV